MPFNLLLLPLLGGYIVANFGNLSKFAVLRSDGHRLLFASASAGVALLILATIIRSILISIFFCSQTAWLFAGWHRLAPFDYSGIALLALLLAFPVTRIINELNGESLAVDRAIKRKGDPLELLLRRAFGETKMIAVTVKNGKVYVGYVKTMFNPALAIESIGIIPQMSGYRDATTKNYVFTTNYIETYNRIREEARKRLDDNGADADMSQWEAVEEDLSLRDFELVILLREIESATIFDPEIYERHFSESADASSSDI